MKKLLNTPTKRFFFIGAVALILVLLVLTVGTAMITAFTPQPQDQPQITMLDFAGIVDTGNGTGQPLLLSIDESGVGTRNIPLAETRTVFQASGMVQVNYSDGSVKSLQVPQFDIVVEGDTVVFYLPFATVTCGQVQCVVNSLNFAFPTPYQLAPQAQP